MSRSLIRLPPRGARRAEPLEGPGGAENNERAQIDDGDQRRGGARRCGRGRPGAPARGLRAPAQRQQEAQRRQPRAELRGLRREVRETEDAEDGTESDPRDARAGETDAPPSCPPRRRSEVVLTGSAHYNVFGSQGSDAFVRFRHLPTLEDAVAYLRCERGCEESAAPGLLSPSRWWTSRPASSTECWSPTQCRDGWQRLSYFW